MPSPTLVEGKEEAAGSGRPASSAQVDSAEAVSAQADSAQSIRPFSLRFPPDVEYMAGRISTVAVRGASSVPRPMPPFDVNPDYVPYVTIDGIRERPVTRLPQSNLEKVEPPPGMSYDETYEWELSRLLEGLAACYEPLPTWSHGSIHFDCSKYLAYATRHSPGIKTTKGNWVSVEWLLGNSRKRMSTPSILFQTIMYNDKQRYQFSRPIYQKAEPRRATGQSRASGQIYYHAKVFVRAFQGHSVSASQMASLQLSDEASSLPASARRRPSSCRSRSR